MASPELKYKTLAELQSAYAYGELKDPIMLDNDACGLYQDGIKVWDGEDPDTLLRDALDLLGIPHRDV